MLASFTILVIRFAAAAVGETRLDRSCYCITVRQMAQSVELLKWTASSWTEIIVNVEHCLASAQGRGPSGNVPSRSIHSPVVIYNISSTIVSRQTRCLTSKCRLICHLWEAALALPEAAWRRHLDHYTFTMYYKTHRYRPF